MEKDMEKEKNNDYNGKLYIEGEYKNDIRVK